MSLGPLGHPAKAIEKDDDVDELEIPEIVRGDLHEQINSQCTLRWKRKVLRKLHDENHHNDELINKLGPKKFTLKSQIGVSQELKTFLMKGYDV